MSEDMTLEEFVEENKPDEAEVDRNLYLPEIDRVPEDWDLVTIEDIAEDLIGGGTPSKNKAEYWGGEIPWASVKDLNGIELDDTEDHITNAGVENSATNLVSPNSTIVSTRMTVGEPFLNRVEMAINQDMKAILPARNRINPLFLVYSLWDKDPYLKSLGRGTTVDGITTRDLSLTHLGLPSVPEQRKIATVLYTVDRAIEKTEEIIEKYRRIYAGLLQSEFHEGQKDDTKDAGALGRVPTSWSIVPISEVAEVTMGNSPKSEHYNSEGDGLPFYQGANEFGERSPTPDRWCSAPKKVGKPGDTLLNIRSHTNVGRVNKAHHECCIGRGLAAITPGEKIDEDYLYHHLRERENYINSIASGSTFDSVNTEEVESVKMTLPPMDTQQKIASSLSNIQNGILKQKEIVEKFDRLKRGLMQDLLSGKVRTTDINIEVPKEITQHG